MIAERKSFASLIGRHFSPHFARFDHDDLCMNSISERICAAVYPWFSVL